MKRVTWAQARQVVPVLPRIKGANGFVYFASGDDGLVKIGHSKTPQRRVAVMNGDVTRARFKERHGFDPGRAQIALLITECGLVHERAVHCALLDEHPDEYMGGEWFRGDVISTVLAAMLALASEAGAAVACTEGQQLLDAHLAKYGSTADLACETGISGSRLSRYRNGQQNPTTGARVTLQRTVGIPILAWDRAPEMH